MGLLNDLVTEGLNTLGLKTGAGVSDPRVNGPDFPAGMTITEIINGRFEPADAIHLTGRFLPLQPFEFGGEQRIVREEYPGSSEPTIQVLGPKESETTIKLELRTNKFRSGQRDKNLASLSLQQIRQIAQEYQELIDAMRIRGNLVFVEMGEWHRYAVIKQSKFRVFTLQKIDAEITFEIIGFNQPKGWRVIKEGDQNVIAPNKTITNAAFASLLAAKNFPDTMPQTAIDLLNNAIGDVANAVSKVTNFVEGIIDDADKLVASANRAIGLIKNARSIISKSRRRLGGLADTAAGLRGQASSAAQGAVNLVKNGDHTATTMRDFSNLALLLAEMQKKFATYVTQVPFRRHLIRRSDTLQNISMKYYNTADNWKKIYDHNKLSSTELVVGTILEIPKV